MAKDVDDLLKQLDGREIRRFDGTTVRLRTPGLQRVRTETSWRDEVLDFLPNPLVSYFLLLLGIGGIYVEMSHPGLVFPAVVGALCLLLFAFSTQLLPVSSIGILLIALAIVLFVLVLKIVSHGMLTVGGLLCLVIGSLMLFQGPIPELRLPLAVVLPASLTLAAACAIAVRLALRAQRTPVATGVEGLVGEIGLVTQEIPAACTTFHRITRSARGSR